MTPQQIERAWKAIRRLRRQINGIRSKQLVRLADSMGFQRVGRGDHPRFEKPGRRALIFPIHASRPLAPGTAREVLDFLEGELLWEDGLHDG